MTLEIITADTLGSVRHGFFTRKGGASTGVFTGLNGGQGSSDQAEAVAINRRRVAEALGVRFENLINVHQVHSGSAVPVTGPFEEKPNVDGMATATPGVALMVLTADCAPVLFADRDAGVIGAAHAGWRGAKDGVLEATVEEMERLGADRQRIGAVVGPTISQANYEVGQEFLETFQEEDEESLRFFVNGQGDRYQFDLPGYVLHRLRSFGVGEAEWTRHCTYADEQRFYSYRRATHRKEADYGRLMAAIRL